MFSQGNIENNNKTTNDISASVGLRYTTELNEAVVDSDQLKAKSTVMIIDPQTKTGPYNSRLVEDTYIPSIQSTQLNKQDEIASVPYYKRLLNIMNDHSLICRPVPDDGKLVLRVDGPELELIMCTEPVEKDGSSEKCKCNKYYPPKFEILGSSCHFCNHSIGLHRLKPEHELIIFDDTKSESERNEYKYWFDKFIELQRLYCSTNKNLSFDDNLFIKIYDQSRQASLRFIQSPHYRYVLIKYAYDGVYDEGENLFKTTYQIISLQTMLTVKTDERLQHSCSYYRDGTQTESGFRTILWDLNQPATLIATSVKNLGLPIDNSNQAFIERIVNIECPSIN